MPIYDYRCTSCGFEKEVMRKISDEQLTTCPECGKETFAKQVYRGRVPAQGQRLVRHRLQGWLQAQGRKQAGSNALRRQLHLLLTFDVGLCPATKS